MITPEIYQDYSDYLSSIIESEYIINDIESLMYNTSSYLAAPVNDPTVISLKNEISRSINNNDAVFINRYATVDRVITALQQRIINSYGDLNAYLKDNDIRVGYYFALFSDRLGFTIDDENIEYVILDAGSTYTVESDVSIKFNLIGGLTTATVIVYGNSFTVAISDDQFVWDFGGSGEYTFLNIGDSITRTVGAYTFYITWMGFSSFIFNIYLSPILRNYNHWVFAGSSCQDEGDDTEQIAIMDAALAAGYTGVFFAFSWWAFIEQWSEASLARMTAIREHAREIGMTFVLGCMNPSNYTDNYYTDGESAEVIAEGMPATEMRFIVQGDGSIVPDPNDLDIRFNAVVPAGNTNIAVGDSPWYVGVLDPTEHTYVHVSFRVKASVDYDDSTIRVTTIGWRTVDGVEYPTYTFQNYQQSVNADWTEINLTFNTQESEKIYFYISPSTSATVGSIDFDTLVFAPAGIMNVLRRDNTPFIMTSEDGLTTYTEGVDFENAEDINIRTAMPYGSIWHTPVPEMNKVGSALSTDDVVLCSYYHIGFYRGAWRPCYSDTVYRARLSTIMTELRNQWDPDEYSIMADEIRLSGWDPACTSLGTQGQQLADFIASIFNIIQLSDPSKTVSTWSDSFDPYHNARAVGAWYMNPGSFYGSWLGLDASMKIINWNRQKQVVDEDDNLDAGGLPRWERAIQFFRGIGHRQILAGFYDSLDTDFEEEWVAYAQPYNYDGAMYSTFLPKDYTQLVAYLNAVRKEEA